MWMLTLMLAVAGTAQADEDAKGTPVTITSTEVGTVITQVTGRATATGSGGSASATFTDDLCIAPCSLSMEPGLYEIYATGPDQIAGAFQFQVRDEPINITVTPARSSKRTMGAVLATLGFSGATTFGPVAGTLGLLYGLGDDSLNYPPLVGASVGATVGCTALGILGVMMMRKNVGSWAID